MASHNAPSRNQMCSVDARIVPCTGYSGCRYERRGCFALRAFQRDVVGDGLANRLAQVGMRSPAEILARGFDGRYAQLDVLVILAVVIRRG